MARKPSIVDSLGERENLLQLMLTLKTDDRATIGSVFEIVFSLLMGGHVDLLGRQPSTVFLAIFSLVPHLWGSYKKPAEAAEVAKSLADLGRIGNVQDALNDICSYEKRSRDSVKVLAEILVGQLGDADVQLLLGFLTQVVRSVQRLQREAAYAMTDALIELRAKVCQWQEVSNLAYAAGTDFECQSSAITCDFLRTLMRMGVVAHLTKFSSGKFSMFPTLPKVAFDFRDWAPHAKDLFSEFKFYPPMLITEVGYSGSQIVRDVRHVIDTIETIPPIDHWYAQMVGAREQHKHIAERSTTKQWNVVPDPDFFRRLQIEVTGKSTEPAATQQEERDL
jgi:hypothetical protein